MGSPVDSGSSTNSKSTTTSDAAASYRQSTRESTTTASAAAKLASRGRVRQAGHRDAVVLDGEIRGEDVVGPDPGAAFGGVGGVDLAGDSEAGLATVDLDQVELEGGPGIDDWTTTVDRGVHEGAVPEGGLGGSGRPRPSRRDGPVADVGHREISVGEAVDGDPHRALSWPKGEEYATSFDRQLEAVRPAGRPGRPGTRAASRTWGCRIDCRPGDARDARTPVVGRGVSDEVGDVRDDGFPPSSEGPDSPGGRRRTSSTDHLRRRSTCRRHGGDRHRQDERGDREQRGSRHGRRGPGRGQMGRRSAATRERSP